MNTNFSYIFNTHYNRKAFIKLLVELLVDFPDRYELSISEFHHLIETICPNFPKKMVLDASLPLTKVSGAMNDNNNNKDSCYYLEEFLVSLNAIILYGEWLKMIEEFFVEEASIRVIPVNKLTAKIHKFNSNFSKAFTLPPIQVLLAIINEMPQFKKGEIAFNEFRTNLVLSKRLKHLINAECM